MENTDEALEYGSRLLTGERVRLRELRDDDLGQLVMWWNQPGSAPLQTGVIKPRPAGPLREMFQKWSSNEADSSVGFCVVDKETDALLGHIGLFGINARARAGELGVVIGSDHTSAGYGTDAVQVMVRYGFEELNLNRIQLHVFGYNTRAIAAYRKAGFVEEGRRRQATFHQGEFHDDVLMSILADEWTR